jgi:hypothetical protein
VAIEKNDAGFGEQRRRICTSARLDQNAIIAAAYLLRYTGAALRPCMRTYVTRFALSASMAFAIGQGLLPAQVFPYPKPADPRRFPILAWGLSPSDPEQLKLMKAAGFNVSGFCRVEDLDKIHAAGLACFIRDPVVAGYDWENLPPREKVAEAVAELIKKIGDNPAALGISLKDEPSSSMFAGLSEVAEILEQKAPKLWPYVNGLPSNAGRARIGHARYDDYLRGQVRQVGQPFISYDHYALSEGKLADSFFANLEIARRISLELKVPFWNCILAAALPRSMEPSLATISAQAYSTLAYGGRGIQYFTYLTPDEAPFITHAAIDAFGGRTPVWDALRRINGEVLTLLPILLRLHSTGVYYYPSSFEPDQTESQIVESVRVGSSGPAVPARLLIGEFADEENRKFLLVVNTDLAASVSVRLQMVDGKASISKISPRSGAVQPFDSTGEWIAPGAGVLVVIG